MCCYFWKIYLFKILNLLESCQEGRINKCGSTFLHETRISIYILNIWQNCRSQVIFIFVEYQEYKKSFYFVTTFTLTLSLLCSLKWNFSLDFLMVMLQLFMFLCQLCRPLLATAAKRKTINKKQEMLGMRKLRFTLHWRHEAEMRIVFCDYSQGKSWLDHQQNILNHWFLSHYITINKVLLQ